MLRPQRRISLDTGRILKEVEAEIAKLERIAKALKEIETDPTPAQPKRGRRTMSAATRKKLGDAQRARWAKVKANLRKGKV
jgi:hypothetical protein